MTIAPKIPAEPVTFIEGKPVGWVAECPFCRHMLHISSEPPLLPSAAYLRGDSPQSHWPFASSNAERALVKDLIATVERLCNGLEWNLQHHPSIMNQSDEEALAEARAVLARTQFQQLKETRMIPAELSQRIATQLKKAYLRRQPGMDEVAVALNARPTYDEVEAVTNVLRKVEEAGYSIVKKEPS